MNIVAKKGNYIGIIFSKKEFSEIFGNIEEMNAYQLITFVENIIVPFFEESNTEKYKKLSSFYINDNYKIVMLNAIDSHLNREDTIEDVLLKIKNNKYSGYMSFNKSFDLKLLEDISKSAVSEIRFSLQSENEICIDMDYFGITAIIEDNGECSTVFKKMLNKMKNLNEDKEQNNEPEEPEDEDKDDEDDEKNDEECAELNKLIEEYNHAYNESNGTEDTSIKEKDSNEYLDGNGYLYAKIQLRDIFMIKNSHILDEHRVDLLKRTVHGNTQYGIKIYCSNDNCVMLQILDFIHLIKESLPWDVETEDILKKI